MKFNFKKNIIVIILLIIVIFTCAYLYDNKENFQGYTLGHRLNNLFYDNSTSDNPDECIIPALMEGGIQKYAIGFTNTNHTYKLSDNNIHYLSKQDNQNYNFVKENKYIADNFPEECNCYVKVTGSNSDNTGNLSFNIVNFDRSLNDCSGVLYFDLSLDITPVPITHNIDILFFNKNNSLFNFVNVNPPSQTNLPPITNINNPSDTININSLVIDNNFANKYYDYLNIGLKFLSSQLYLHNGNNTTKIKVYNFDFALNPSNNNLLPFVNNGTVSFSLSDNDIENNMGISTTLSTSLNNGLESGVYINDVENSNIDANSNNVGNNSNNVYNYPNQLNLEFENSLGRLLNNKRLSQINGHNHIRDHYVNGYIADGDERLLNNRNNDMWFESAMNSKDNPIINGNNMNNINDLLRSNCSNTLNNNNCLNQNINQCGTDINESCQNNNCCSKINCKENGKNNNNRELKHIHEHSHEKNNEYKGEEDNNNEIDDENSSGNNGYDNTNSGNGGSGSGGGGVFNNGRVGYNKNKAGNLDSNSQVNNNNRMNVNNNGYFNYNNVDSMTNVRPLVADFSKF